jgi:hypothetical protein
MRLRTYCFETPSGAAAADAPLSGGGPLVDGALMGATSKTRSGRCNRAQHPEGFDGAETHEFCPRTIG